MVGCDMSDRSLMLQVAHNAEPAQKRSFGNSPEGRRKMIEWLQERSRECAGAQIVFAYEAGPHGFGLYDELTSAGIRAHVLAPTLLPQSAKSRKDKTGEKDALRILEVLRGHLLAGNRLPTVGVPDPTTRDDREVVRSRLDARRKARRVGTQIRMLVKRAAVRKPDGLGQGWTIRYRAWLRGLAQAPSPLGPGARTALSSLLRQWAMHEEEIQTLDQAVAHRAAAERYRLRVERLAAESGVGVLTAMVFLTEMGDLNRFSNRRQVAAYLGIVASKYLTGNAQNRYGRITRQGSSRVRALLCQAAWRRVKSDPAERARYERIIAGQPNRAKRALVACMRHLAIRLWHRARGVNGKTPPPVPQSGRRQFALPAQPRKYERRSPAHVSRRNAAAPLSDPASRPAAGQPIR
jgi:transposase